MTIDEAIEILEDLQTALPQVPPEDRIDAVKLGIEALNAVKACKICRYPCHLELLPGETEEVKVE